METIAIIGGTGNIGYGLALRWAGNGHRVLIGSRTADRAESAASELRAKLAEGRGGSGGGIEGLVNPEAAAKADIVAVTVPFAVQRPTLESIREGCKGKIVIDVTVPLVPPRVSRVQLPPEDSAALVTQEVLGEEARVVSAFQNVSAVHLADLGHPVDCDVLICGDDPEARGVVVRLAAEAGLRGIQAGRLANSVAAEALTSVLIWLNQRHKVAGTGIRITGLDGH